MMLDQKQFSAVKMWIADFLNSKYVREADETKQNYIIISEGKTAYRVNILGTVINISLDDNFIIIDDGTGRVQIKSFENNNSFSTLLIGDLVLVIGKPREFGEKYILPEIVKKVNNSLWFELRKKELGQVKKELIDNFEEPSVTEEFVANNDNKILSEIKKLDEGEGANIDLVLSAVNSFASEKEIERLLKEGEIFQTKPGRIKVLE